MNSDSKTELQKLEIEIARLYQKMHLPSILCRYKRACGDEQ